MLEKHIGITERTCRNREFAISVLEHGCVELGQLCEEETDAENGPGTKWGNNPEGRLVCNQTYVQDWYTKDLMDKLNSAIF